MTARIDAHVHLWDRATDPQDWIDPVTMSAIDRDFGAEDLSGMLRATGMERAVLVQASNSLEESVRLSRSDPEVVAGLVAWVDLTRDVPPQLAEAGAGSVPVVGVRHLAHIDPDPEWLLRADVADGLAALGREGLTFDLVVRDWQLGQAAQAAARHDGVAFVLDHLGGPLADDADASRWERGLRALASLPNVAAKVSGLTSGLTPGRWTADDLRGIVDTAVEAFGPDRLLYGSDWPLAELGGGAPAWREAFDALVAGLSTSERDAMLGGNAARVYSVG
ncbi:amidohydrolase family protein [Leifsonia xyli]|uniref:amidohydrolase family protein n=1 Tax=Leifsonia xyli TaxID=1575 RepID=UPI003D672ECE